MDGGVLLVVPRYELWRRLAAEFTVPQQSLAQVSTYTYTALWKHCLIVLSYTGVASDLSTQRLSRQ